MKSAAVAFGALNADLSVHHLDKTRADRQTQTRAAEFSGSRAIGLRKGLEDRALFVRRDSNTRITYGEMKRTRCVLHAFDFNVHHDLAVIGELDGVADQV